MKKVDFAIIGAGPCGISAAIQLKKSGIEPMLFEKESVGGLLNYAGMIDNYPGFPEGIKSEELIKRMHSHLKKIGVKPIFEEVKCVEKHLGRLLIRSASNEYLARYLILCTGTRCKKADEWIEKKAKDRLSYDVKQLKDVSGKKIAIIGSGDAAFDYALQISGKNKVYVFGRSQVPRAIKSLVRLVKKENNIDVFMENKIQGIDALNDGRLKLLFDNHTCIVDYLVCAIGRIPNIDFIKGLNLDNEKQKGRLKIAGSVCTGNYRQTAIAVGMGIKAAMEISENAFENNS